VRIRKGYGKNAVDELNTEVVEPIPTAK